jgi:hypothetical protein
LRPYTADLAPVVSMSLWRTANLPGEFQPFLMVSLQARVAGYVEKVLVDRGSAVPSQFTDATAKRSGWMGKRVRPTAILSR